VACLFLELEPILTFFGLALLGHIDEPLDEVVRIRRLLFVIVVTSSQAIVLIVHDDITGLLVPEEESIGEEHFAAAEHLFLRVFLWFGDQLVDQHIKGHVLIPLVELVRANRFSLKLLGFFYLCMAGSAATNFMLLVGIVVLGRAQFLSFAKCSDLVSGSFFVLMLATVATFEKGSAFDVPEELFLFFFVFLPLFILVFQSRLSL